MKQRYYTCLVEKQEFFLNIHHALNFEAYIYEMNGILEENLITKDMQ